MTRPTVFLDSSVLLTAFGPMRNGGKTSFILDTDSVTRTTFEKCVFECFLIFRGVGGNKSNEGRQDWAQRFLRLEGDPVPLGEAIGKLHFGSPIAAHFWTGQAEEAQFTLPESFEEYMSDVKRYVPKEEWDQASKQWENIQKIFENHRRYLKLFADFRMFLSEHNINLISYESVYKKEKMPSRLMTMEGLSQRSTIPNEDFEIIVAALLSESDAFVSTDKRLLKATASIEANLKRCNFIHLNEVREYVESLQVKG